MAAVFGSAANAPLALTCSWPSARGVGSHVPPVASSSGNMIFAFSPCSSSYQLESEASIMEKPTTRSAPDRSTAWIRAWARAASAPLSRAATFATRSFWVGIPSGGVKRRSV